MKPLFLLCCLQAFICMAFAQPDNKTINVQIFGGTSPFTNSEWNNWNIGTASFTTPKNSANFLYSDGSSSGISASLSMSGGIQDNGFPYLPNAQICPGSTLRFDSYITSTRTLVIRGLDNSTKYKIELYGSRNRTDQQITKFAIGAQSVNVLTDTNGSRAAVFNNVVPSSGTITVNISRVVTYNYINAFKITKLVDGPVNTAPIVNAGNGQSITLPNNSVNLSAAITPGNSTVTTIAWVQVSGPASAAIQSPSSAQTNVSGLQAGTYVFRCTATDANGLIGSATVSVTVNNATPPTVSAGNNQAVAFPATSASLQGSATAGSSNIISLAWTQVSGPSAAGISNPSELATSVTNLQTGTYVFRLTAVDANGLSSFSDVSLTVTNTPVPPSVTTGADQQIILPVSTATITATITPGSYSIANSSWTQLSGPSPASIARPDSTTTAVSNLQQGNYIFKIIVTDANGGSSSASTTVAVNAAAAPPVVNAGNNQSINLPLSSANLSGTITMGSAGINSIQWSQLGGPSAATIQSPANLTTVVTNLVQGIYQFQLLATDSNGLSSSSAVSITVNGSITSKKHIAVIGSSTAAGYFNNLFPIDSSYVRMLSRYYQAAGVVDTIYNFAVNAANIYNAMPTWYTAGDTMQPAGVYSVDRNRNITRALSTHPGVILCHYPSNNYDVLSISQAMFAFRTIKATADSAGVPIFFVGTQPRGNWTIANKQKLIAINDSLRAAFGPLFISYYDSVAQQPGSLYMKASLVLANDSVHMNPSGHRIIFNQVVKANIFSIASGVYAGANATIRLPQDSTNLAGLIITGSNPIVQTTWQQVSGPSNAIIQNTQDLNTVVSALVAGTYIFKLTGISDHGDSSFSNVQLTVLLPLPPTVNAGGNQTLLSPLNTVHLLATISQGGGGPVVSLQWAQRSGPSISTLSSADSAGTYASGLVVGKYVFVFTAIDSAGGIGTDSAAVTITRGSVINVRLYGGTAPYTNPQWNNWNIGNAAFSSPVTSGTFKWNDGSASNVYASLGLQGGLHDNGSSYGKNATMCPDSTLRYDSYITSTRKLIISGLDNTARYNLDIYASHVGTTGQITKFAIGTQSINVSTDNNISQPASFTNVAPSAGTITVTISRVVTYNYINGFTLTKIGGGTLSARQPAVDGESSDVNGVNDLSVFPNPVSDHLTVTNSRNLNLRISIFDITGRPMMVTTGSASVLTISVNTLKKGTYVLLVEDGVTGIHRRQLIIKD